ncbi:TIGR00730 family Rossman fold protein [Streptomyces sp. NPDC057257]|uniref:LOG family protein n=1 Tax=Streptomyces sp. NPDC057257 TaxID=3346071 RepID=UPI0036257164
MDISSVTVFCGASRGHRDTHLSAAAELGQALARAGIRIVYGGAAIGLMGAVADAALKAGGTVVGVLPESLVPHEIAHLELSELHIVPDLHRRKALMAELGDAFVALPGGLGTAEELFEALTWSQLGLHDKPCFVLDNDGYYRHLLTFLEHAVREGFLTDTDTERIIVRPHVRQIVEQLLATGTSAVPGITHGVGQSRRASPP